MCQIFRPMPTDQIDIMNSLMEMYAEVGKKLFLAYFTLFLLQGKAVPQKHSGTTKTGLSSDKDSGPLVPESASENRDVLLQNG